MSDNVYVLYDPDGRGFLVALVYRVLKNNDIAGWFYGHAGRGVYDSAYFTITRNENFEPVHYYAGRLPTEWDRDYLKARPRLEASIFVTEALQRQLEAIRQRFAEHWLVAEGVNKPLKLNRDRMKGMHIEDDDSYSYTSDDLDLDILQFIASKWPLNTPLAYYRK